jgi:hypothetical protein
LKDTLTVAKEAKRLAEVEANAETDDNDDNDNDDGNDDV